MVKQKVNVEILSCHFKMILLSNKSKTLSKFKKEFDDAHFVTQLDMLQDCIYELTEKYNSLLNKPEKETT